MAQLCGQGSACKAEAGELFSPIFEQALGDTNELVRIAAVDGLTSIGKGTFLLRFRKGALIEDPSPIIRNKLVALAGEVGGADDLPWLHKKVGSGQEGDLAWEAMVRILRRSQAVVLTQWVERFKTGATEQQLSNDRKLMVLEMAAQKVKDQPDLLRKVQRDLAELYGEMGNFQSAAEYWGMLHQSAANEQEKAAILPCLLEAYLRLPSIDRAANLIDNCLLIKDLDPNGPVIATIERYLAAPPAGVDPNALLTELLSKVAATTDRPMWQQQRQKWTQQTKPAQQKEPKVEPNQPK
jgi:hypothetical protein